MWVYTGGEEAGAHIRLSNMPSEETVERIRACKTNVLSLEILPVA
jgi:hypothetical protein